jgi:hypothetical protein
MLVCDLCLLNLVILVVSGLSGVLGTLGWILLSYLVHVGPITWEVLQQLPTTIPSSFFPSSSSPIMPRSGVDAMAALCSYPW